MRSQATSRLALHALSVSLLAVGLWRLAAGNNVDAAVVAASAGGAGLVGASIPSRPGTLNCKEKSV
ncbi:MAG: hypothetical protein U0835_17335 [Isosphaeraceae bacterium]